MANEREMEMLLLKERLAGTASRCAKDLVDALENCVRNDVGEVASMLRSAHAIVADLYLSACYASAEKRLMEAKGGAATPSALV